MIRIRGLPALVWMVLAASAETPSSNAFAGVPRLLEEGRERAPSLAQLERRAGSIEGWQAGQLFDGERPSASLPAPPRVGPQTPCPPAFPRMEAGSEPAGPAGYAAPAPVSAPDPVPTSAPASGPAADPPVPGRLLGEEVPAPRAARPSDLNRYDPLILRYAGRFGLDPRLIKAIIAAESAFVRTARSSMGALGLMQLMPETAEGLGVSRERLMDPDHNIRAGAAYLAYLFRKAAGGAGAARGRFARAPRWLVARVLAAYNAGPRMLRARALGGSHRAYIHKVLVYYRAEISRLRAAWWEDERDGMLRSGSGFGEPSVRMSIPR